MTRICTGSAAFPYRAGTDFPLSAVKSFRKRSGGRSPWRLPRRGLDNCPFNADVFVRDGRVWVIEIGGRSGATCIPELLSIYCGFSYYEKMLRAALGEPVQFPVRGKRACMARLLFSETGRAAGKAGRSVSGRAEPGRYPVAAGLCAGRKNCRRRRTARTASAI